MPSFLYPAFLVGLAAVAVPIVLHMLRNEQAPEVPFSAVRLLRGVKVEHAQRRRIRDWLLLALRAAALALLAIAFARPYFSGGESASGATTVLLLDRSASMGLDGAWRQAREAVVREIDRTPAGHPLALVAFDDRAEVVVPPTRDRSAVRAALGRLHPGVGAGRYQTAIARAVAVVDDADAEGGRLVLVSDLQGTAGEARATVPAGVTLEVARVTSTAGNLAVLGARPVPGGIRAAIRNDGRAPANARVRLDVDGRLIREKAIELPPSELVEVTLDAPAQRGWARVGLASADPSGLTADDARYFEVGTSERRRVLIVSGASGSFYIEAALRASEESGGFEIARTSVSGTTAALGRRPGPEVVFLVSPRGLDRGGREAIGRYARAGGSVFIAASEALNEPGYAQVLDGMTVSGPRPDDPVLALGAVEGRHPLFRQLGVVGEGMMAARFTRAWHVRAPEWQVLARFDDGSGALFERQVGAGRVIVFASDLNRDWNDLPLQTAFVPFVHEVVRYLAPEKGRRDYTPGALPAGMQSALGFVSLPSGRRVAVNADPRESEPARMDAVQFTALVRQRGSLRDDPRATTRRAQATEQGQGLWRYGLMLMFGTLIVEGLVGAGRAIGQAQPSEGRRA